MKLTFSVQGDVKQFYGNSIKEGKAGVTRAVGIAGAQLQANWRGQVATAGLGAKLARTIRKQVYPSQTTSLHAAALVWSKAPVIIDAFERGVLIKSSNGFYLAIPLPAAGAKGVGSKRITPAGWEQRTGRRLVFIGRKGRHGLLVDQGVLGQSKNTYATAFRQTKGRTRAQNQSIPIFVLVRQAKLPKKLSLLEAASAAQNSLASLILSEWRDDGASK